MNRPGKLPNRLFTRVLVLGTIASTAALLTGCKSASPLSGSPSPPIQKTDKVVGKTRTVMQTRTLKAYVHVAQHLAERTEADLLRVKVAFENVKKKDLWVDIKVVFYNGDGFMVEETNWQPLLLQSNQLTYFETVSLSSQAYDYSVILREPRQSKV